MFAGTLVTHMSQRGLAITAHYQRKHAVSAAASQGSTGQNQQRRSRRHKGWGTMRKLIIAIGVVLVLLLVADRVALMLATRQVDQRIEREIGSPVNTAVEGFPFLPSALGRTLPKVQVQANQIHLSRADLTARDVDFTFTDVVVRGSTSARAGQLEGSFVIPYGEVQRRANRPRDSLSGTEQGLLRVRQPFRSGGAAGGEATVLARPQVQGSVVRLVPVSVEWGGQTLDASAGVGAQIASALATEVSLNQLPTGMEIADISAKPQGLWVQVRGRDAALTGW